jgi:hypothetical protein
MGALSFAEEAPTIVSAALQQLDSSFDSLITEMINASDGEFTAKKVRKP